MRGAAPMKMNIRPQADVLGFAGPVVDQGQLLQVVVSGGALHFGAGADGDLGVLLDLLDQVVRHRRLQRRGAHHDGHRFGLAGQVHRGLAGRIRPADHVDLFVLAFRRDGHGGPVVDAAAGQLVAAVGRQLAVGDAGGQDDRVRVDGAAVGEPHGAFGSVDLQGGGRAGGDQFGAELLGLPARPIGQLAAGHPVRESRGSSRSVELWPAWPPVAVRSMSTVRRPSEAP